MFLPTPCRRVPLSATPGVLTEANSKSWFNRGKLQNLKSEGWGFKYINIDGKKYKNIRFDTTLSYWFNYIISI